VLATERAAERSGLGLAVPAREEERELDLRVLEAVRAVRGVLADVRAEELAHGAFVGLRRVGRAHELAPRGDGVVLLEGADDHGAAGHEVAELAEERAVAVHGVEAFRLRARERGAVEGHDLEAVLLDVGEDVAGVARGDGVGLDDEEGTFESHARAPSGRRLPGQSLPSVHPAHMRRSPLPAPASKAGELAFFQATTKARPMQRLRLFALFHVNLAFSSIPEEHRPVVLERCYWPLLRMVRRLALPVGLELTGMTLRWIHGLDPAWVDELRALEAQGLVEVIGSGRAQLIGPLVPWRVNAANLRWGLHDYRELLGLTPKTLLVNEQAYSRGCVDNALEAGFENVVIEWENAWRANPSWDRRWAYAPQFLRSSSGASTRLLWNQSIAFQKVQRFVHGELELEDLLAFVDAQRGPEPRAFCIYGNDAEVFDYRPGRFQTESVIEHREWERLESLFAALKSRADIDFELPRAIARSEFPALGDRRLEPQSAAEPVPTKKQGKYNVTRWAVTGRDDLGINTACQRIHDALVDVPLDDPRWAELCELWSSDFRTHITDDRWRAFRDRLASASAASTAAAPAPFESAHAAATSPAPALRVERGRRFLAIEGARQRVVLDMRKGLCIEDLVFPERSKQSLLGTIPHGFFEDVRWSADWFSGHLVFEAPGKPKVTDLERVDPVVTETDHAVVVRATVPTALGPITKTVTVDRAEERLDLAFELAWPELPVGSLRLGHVLLKPGAWNERALRYRTHLGGAALETFACGSDDFDHGAPVSFLVSASTAVGMTEGVIELGDDALLLRVTVDRSVSAAVGSVAHHLIGRDRFFQCCASLREMDETTRKAETKREEPLRFRMRIEPIGA
jgi:hypothetical protein